MSYRDKCLDAYGEVCIICSSEQNVEVHHIDGDDMNHSILNLMPVCSKCHSDIHHNEDNPFNRFLTGDFNRSDWSFETYGEDEWFVKGIMQDPLLIDKMRADGRGRISLGKEYAGMALGVMIEPLKPKS